MCVLSPWLFCPSSTLQAWLSALIWDCQVLSRFSTGQRKNVRLGLLAPLHLCVFCLCSSFCHSVSLSVYVYLFVNLCVYVYLSASLSVYVGSCQINVHFLSVYQNLFFPTLVVLLSYHLSLLESDVLWLCFSVSSFLCKFSFSFSKTKCTITMTNILEF